MDSTLKIKILQVLRTYLSNNQTVKLFFEYLITQDPETVLDYTFECVGLFKHEASAHSAFEKLSRNMIVWNDPSFEKFLNSEKEEDNFLETPLTVAEGALKCKCGSKRIFSFSKQTKSGDESTTVFALCSKCKSKWIV